MSFLPSDVRGGGEGEGLSGVGRGARGVQRGLGLSQGITSAKWAGMRTFCTPRPARGREDVRKSSHRSASSLSAREKMGLECGNVKEKKSAFVKFSHIY